MLAGLVSAMRPRQWVKSSFVLAPLVFAQELFEGPKLLRALGAFLCFSLLASAVYILNDLLDVEADRAHPVKKARPIASGRLSEAAARVALSVLVALSLAGGYLLDQWLALTLAAYLVLNIAYSFGLKRIAYLDVLCIAAGFELRVLAGAYAVPVPPSHYLLLVTILLATFLGLGKRLHELVQQEASGSSRTRGVLKHYSKRLVTLLMGLTGVATIATYVVYTLDPHTREMFGTDYLVASSIFVLFGVLRFLHLVRSRPDAESPTEEMLRDKLFVANGILAAIALVAIIYFG